jgi:hypothetical protein
MGHADFYRKGQWNAICDECGQKFKASEMKKRWDGLMVCRADWNIRQPQDFVRGIPDPQAVPWSRPPQQLVFRAGLPQLLYDTFGGVILDTAGQPILTVPN